MKNLVTIFLAALMATTQADAQLSEGGIPLSRFEKESAGFPAPITIAENPNQQPKTVKDSRLNLVAGMAPLDWRFPHSGSFTRNDAGALIWRSVIQVPDANALGLYYSRFRLPAGVRLYISNHNGQHQLGAYTEQNNQPGGRFANEAIQGYEACIELNIEKAVNLNDINLTIDRVAVYTASYAHLAHFANDLQEIDAVDSALTHRSSVCMINAACPEGNGFEQQRSATIQQLIPVSGGLASCSATMINAAGNTPANCKRYLLSASHCEPGNSILSADFDQVLLRFNFLQPTCFATGIPESKTLVGANFVARSNCDETAPADLIKGDFMLLELRENIPLSWSIYLSGWNNDPAIPTLAAPGKKFVGFHHPDGDVKKVSHADAIASYDLGAVGSHWVTELSAGLVSTGSSGSGLFNDSGYLVGIASLAGPVMVDDACKVNIAGDTVYGTSDYVLYSKFSYDWAYNVDGAANHRKLKPWLDPENSGILNIKTVKSDCSTTDEGTSISNHGHELTGNIHLYPNPVVEGKLNMTTNFKSSKNVRVDIIDLTGKKVLSFQPPAGQQSGYTLDVSALPNGLYLVKINDGVYQSSAKIVLQQRGL